MWDTHSLVSGLMMVTQSVFSYTLSSSGMPSHGICQEKKRTTEHNQSLRLVVKDMTKSKRAIESKKGKIWIANM